MGRRSTSINLLAFSVAILSQKPNSRKLAHWAKCLHLGVGQVVSECTSINLLAFSVAILSQKPNNRKLAHWAKCLHLGVGQVVSECTSSLSGLTGLRISKDSQLVANCNDLPVFKQLGRKALSKVKQNGHFFSCNGSQSCKVEVNSAEQNDG